MSKHQSDATNIVKHPTDMDKLDMLKSQHARHVNHLNTLKMQIAALRIETDHLEQYQKKFQEQILAKRQFQKDLKSLLLESSKKALNEPNLQSFPRKFLTHIFAVFIGDHKFMKSCFQADNLFEMEVQELFMKEYQSQKHNHKAKIDQKLERTRKHLAEKYEAKLDDLEEKHKSNLVILKQKCYELLQQFLVNNCKDENHIPYLNELKALYLQKTQHL
ncbi:uncharacterized protein LOC132785382 [Drosophila nasuta]|uniref:uncharacterized protein LOC132785382 n=1 Tax=Drosophila nasuta TaxID=42062 RepID=UPI00295EF35B|nr:uncharacterized protein LOC132785382 [Drosophila nasuta]